MQEMFGRYILLERIAIGGMAEIFKAKSPGLGGFEKILAIKRLHPRYSQDADFIEMLIDEARITVELAHSNIGQIFDLGKVDDHYFIAMEYIDGRDLYRVMKRLKDRDIRCPIDGAAYITMEACAGLDYAHRKKDSRGRPLNIVHRDVSPQNVLVSFEGDVKIVDFGIAKAALRAYETESGIIKGKFYYMSPEQAKGEPLDHRTDVFSMGIVLYEMLTGDLLYKDDDDVTLLSRVRRAEIEPPSLMRPEVPRSLEEIVMKALARERADRYPSAQHMQRDLARFLRNSGAVFNKSRLGQLMRELFDSDPAIDGADDSLAEDGRDLMQDRDEYGVDHASVISFAHFDDGNEATNVESDVSLNETADLPAVIASGSVDFLGSDLIEIVEDELELIEDDDLSESAMSDFQSSETAQGFEEEETRAFSRNPLLDGAGPGLPLVAKPMVVPDLKRPDSVVFGDPAPVPRPTPRGRADAGFNRQKTVIVAEAAGDPIPAGRPRGPRLRHEPDRTTTRPSPGRAGFVTKERVIFGSIFIGVLLITGLITSLFLGDDKEPDQIAQKPAVTVPIGGPTLSKPVDPPPPKIGPETGILWIKSTPSGATVQVGDKVFLPTTPNKYEVRAGAPLDLIILAKNYEPYRRKVTPEPGGMLRIVAKLKQKFGRIELRSNPTGSTVFINGDERGKTPALIENLDLTKSTRLRLVHDGFVPYETSIEWGEKSQRQLKIELQSLAVDPLAVAVKEPAEADPPPKKTRRELARERKRAKEKARQRAKARAERRAREREKRRARQRAADRDRDGDGGDSDEGGQGYLSVQAQPWGSVFLDGQQIARETPLIKYRLAAGSHRVYVAFRGDRSDRSRTRTVRIRRGKSQTVRFR